MITIKNISRTLPQRFKKISSDILEELRFRQAIRRLEFSTPKIHYGQIIRANIGGPGVKVNRLNHYFPHHAYGYNLIYTVNGAVPAPVCRRAKKHGIRVVYNANGVLYGAYHPEERWRSINESFRQVYEQADYIFFQSKFAQFSNEYFLGKPTAPWEILYNAVDTNFFRPSDLPRTSVGPVLLTAGHHRMFYRLEVLVRMMPLLRQQFPDIHLIIAGKLGNKTGIRDVAGPIQKLVTELKLSDSVTLLPAYSQAEAPEIYRMADILVHAQWNDVCPSVVIEALSCGLPVVYSNSGGTPELVGEAGIGVSSPPNFDWNEIQIPSYEEFADKVTEAIGQRTELSVKARLRAVKLFDIHPWINRHAEIIKMLLNNEMLG